MVLKPTQQSKLTSNMVSFFAAENIRRMKNHWPQHSLLLNCYKWEAVQSGRGKESLNFAKCSFCSVYFKKPTDQNLQNHFKSAGYWLMNRKCSAGIDDAAAAPSGVSRFVGLSDLPHITHFKTAYFCMEHPTASLSTGGDTTQLAQTIFQDLGPRIDDVTNKIAPAECCA